MFARYVLQVHSHNLAPTYGYTALVTAIIQVGLWLDKKKAAKAASSQPLAVSREDIDPALGTGELDEKRVVATDEEITASPVDRPPKKSE